MHGAVPQKPPDQPANLVQFAPSTTSAQWTALHTAVVGSTTRLSRVQRAQKLPEDWCTIGLVATPKQRHLHRGAAVCKQGACVALTLVQRTLLARQTQLHAGAARQQPDRLLPPSLHQPPRLLTPVTQVPNPKRRPHRSAWHQLGTRRAISGWMQGGIRWRCTTLAHALRSAPARSNRRVDLNRT